MDETSSPAPSPYQDEICEKLIQLSFSKIVNSKSERGGARLRKNLLIIHVLQKARFEQQYRYMNTCVETMSALSPFSAPKPQCPVAAFARRPDWFDSDEDGFDLSAEGGDGASAGTDEGHCAAAGNADLSAKFDLSSPVPPSSLPPSSSPKPKLMRHSEAAMDTELVAAGAGTMVVVATADQVPGEEVVVAPPPSAADQEQRQQTQLAEQSRVTQQQQPQQQSRTVIEHSSVVGCSSSTSTAALTSSNKRKLGDSTAEDGGACRKKNCLDCEAPVSAFHCDLDGGSDQKQQLSGLISTFTAGLSGVSGSQMNESTDDDSLKRNMSCPGFLELACQS